MKIKTILSNPFIYILIIFLITSLYITLFEKSARGVREASPPLRVVSITSTPPLSAKDPCLLPSVICEYEKPKKIIYAYVTGYNSVPSQTDSSPCIGAGGYVCGRTDVVACPRQYDLGTKVKINEKVYTCLDRLSIKYNDRFDIFFDKDIEAALNWGKRYLKVAILN